MNDVIVGELGLKWTNESDNVVLVPGSEIVEEGLPLTLHVVDDLCSILVSVDACSLEARLMPHAVSQKHLYRCRTTPQLPGCRRVTLVTTCCSA